MIINVEETLREVFGNAILGNYQRPIPKVYQFTTLNNGKGVKLHFSFRWSLNLKEAILVSYEVDLSNIHKQARISLHYMKTWKRFSDCFYWKEINNKDFYILNIIKNNDLEKEVSKTRKIPLVYPTTLFEQQILPDLTKTLREILHEYRSNLTEYYRERYSETVCKNLIKELPEYL